MNAELESYHVTGPGSVLQLCLTTSGPRSVQWVSGTMLSFEDLMTSLQDCVITEDRATENVARTLRLFLDKLSESSRSVLNLGMFEKPVKRSIHQYCSHF